MDLGLGGKTGSRKTGNEQNAAAQDELRPPEVDGVHQLGPVQVEGVRQRRQSMRYSQGNCEFRIEKYFVQRQI